MAVVDTNSDPDVIDYPIPGNDDSIKAIQLYCRVINDSLKDVKVARTEKKATTVKKKITGADKKVVKKPSLKKEVKEKKETKDETVEETTKTTEE